jgi:Uma2 family endonuclease
MGEVREYWLLDLGERRADFYLLGPEGHYERQEGDERRICRSHVIPGSWLEVDWLFQQPLPPIFEALKELGLV